MFPKPSSCLRRLWPRQSRWFHLAPTTPLYTSRKAAAWQTLLATYWLSLLLQQHTHRILSRCFQKLLDFKDSLMLCDIALIVVERISQDLFDQASLRQNRHISITSQEWIVTCRAPMLQTQSPQRVKQVSIIKTGSQQLRSFCGDSPKNRPLQLFILIVGAKHVVPSITVHRFHMHSRSRTLPVEIQPGLV